VRRADRFEVQQVANGDLGSGRGQALRPGVGAVRERPHPVAALQQ
jgi:hypothetical protein